jgi:catechol 2,3-dioxygenase
VAKIERDKTEMTVKMALGEIAFRVENLAEMQRFYEEVIGLELMQRFPQAAFFKIAEGVAGHTQILALFDRTAEPQYSGLDVAKSTVDHIAFAIALENFASEKARLESLGMAVRTSEHAWVHWRSLYLSDPEGNLVEFVCYDEAVQ